MITDRVRAAGLRPGCAQESMRRAKRGLFQAAVASLVAVAVGPVAVALAVAVEGPPNPRITSPLNGSSTNNQTPFFNGTTNDQVDEVTLRIYAGPTVSGVPTQSLRTPSAIGGAWSLGPVKTLAPGIYTAQAEQSDLGHTGTSEPVTFTVDPTPPQIALTFPTSGSSTSSRSQLVSGSAGTASGDLPAIMIHLLAGVTIGTQTPLETLVVQASNGYWSATFGGLSPGIYTTQAEQRDSAGNIGMSGLVTFTVTSAPPAAAFSWSPSAPKTGETVSLVSTSTDLGGPITAFEWDLTNSRAFHAGGPVLTTTFDTPGRHVVRLRVTNADGLSSVAEKTIVVSAYPPTPLQPFPIVRIAGSARASGVKLSLLDVLAPVGAQTTVRCRGRGCPAKAVSRGGASDGSNRKTGAVLLAFRRFEHFLRAGIVLEIRVSKPGEIGKYTRFAVRRDKLPVRIDACLSSTDPTPIACPWS